MRKQFENLVFKNEPDETTPISAENLNLIQANIENALRENINLILDNKERIAKESILKASKHIKTLIDEDVMKGDYDEKAKEEKIDMINLYRKEIIN